MFICVQNVFISLKEGEHGLNGSAQILFNTPKAHKPLGGGLTASSVFFFAEGETDIIFYPCLSVSIRVQNIFIVGVHLCPNYFFAMNSLMQAATYSIWSRVSSGYMGNESRRAAAFSATGKAPAW